MTEETTAAKVLDWAIHEAAKHRVQWLPYLPKGKAEYSSREVLNAIGQALSAASVPNNLYREPK